MKIRYFRIKIHKCMPMFSIQGSSWQCCSHHQERAACITQTFSNGVWDGFWVMSLTIYRMFAMCILLYIYIVWPKLEWYISKVPVPSAGLSTYSQETVPGDPWFYLYQAVCCIFQNHPYLVGPLASLRTLELLQLCQLPELRSLALLRTHPWMRQLRGLGSFTNYNKYTNPKLIYIFHLQSYILYIHMHIHIYTQSIIDLFWV